MTLLGIGGAFDADVGIANTNALLQIREDGEVVHRILIDCGHTCGRQLSQIDLTYADIDTVLVTHPHGDHIDGLEVLGYKSKFLYQQLLPVLSPQPVLDAIWASLSPKMGHLQTDFQKSQDAHMTDYFEPVAVDPGAPIPLADERFTVRFEPVVHVWGMPAFALLFDLPDGTRIRWSGDTIFDPEGPLFGDMPEDSEDRIFHDCLFYPYYEATVHTHYESLQTLPEAVRRRLILVHHGRVEKNPPPQEKMTLGQPFDRWTWDL